MPTYTAYFRTDAEFDMHDFEAATPAQALQMALDLVERDPDALQFESYDMLMPIDEIEISGPEGDELAVWQSDDMRLRLAARALLEALEGALYALDDNREGYGPDKATAIAKAKAAIAKATPDDQTG